MFVRMLMNVCLCPWVCIDSSIRIDAKVEARRFRRLIPQPFLPSDSHGVHVDVSVLWPAHLLFVSNRHMLLEHIVEDGSRTQTNFVGTHCPARFGQKE